jgi:hypothetical protein
VRAPDITPDPRIRLRIAGLLPCDVRAATAAIGANTMNTFPILFLTAIPMLADAALAQNDLAFQPRSVRIAIDADFAIALVAFDAARMPVLGLSVLADAVVLPIRRGAGDAADVALPDLAADLYVQVVGWNDTLVASDVHFVAADVDDADRICICSDDDGEQPPLTLGAKRDDAGFVALGVDFEAPTDGYALKLLGTRRADAATLDVHLWRKLPGCFEGLRDVVEHHELRMKFEPVRRVRVFLTDSVLEPAAGSGRLVATFPQ